MNKRTIRKISKRYWRFTALILLAGLVAAVVLLAMPGSALAADRDSNAVVTCTDDNNDGKFDVLPCTTGDGIPISGEEKVTPEEWRFPGNADCEDVGFGYGFKVAQSPNGTFHFTAVDGELTGGAPSDLANYVTISDSNNITFSWESSIGIDAVIVKGGNVGGIAAANVYVYDPESTGKDPGLGLPTGQTISHIEFCYDYNLTAEKSADTEFTRTYNWTIDKQILLGLDENDEKILADVESHTGWFGDSFTSSYEVFVDKTSTDSDFKVSGNITIKNPAPWEVAFEVDDSVGGTPAAVTCPEDDFTLDSGETKVCTYTVDLGDTRPSPDSGTNIATIISKNSNVEGTSASEPYAFGDTPTTEKGDGTINVIDYFDCEVDGDAQVCVDEKDLGSASDDFTFEYDRVFDCSDVEGDYAGDGVYEASFPNDAFIDETGASDDANVNLTCYAPVVSKDVTPAWEQDYQWDLYKNVDETTFVGFAGDAWVFNYDIDLVQTSYDELNFSASGEITVVNPHPTDEMTVDLSDAINGYVGIITPDVEGDCDFDSDTDELTVPADSTATCDYTVDMGNALDDGQDTEYTNTATATIGGGAFIGTDSFTFGDVDPTLAAGSEPAEVNVTDDNATPGVGDAADDDHKAGPFSGSTENVITYQQNGVCPPEGSDLYEAGVYGLVLTNVADIDETPDTDTETVTITCYDPAEAKVIKTTTEGDEDIGQFPLTFELYDPDGNWVETKELGTGGGEFEFETDLTIEGVWTIKEVLPAGWVNTTPNICSIGIGFDDPLVYGIARGEDNPDVRGDILLVNILTGDATKVGEVPAEAIDAARNLNTPNGFAYDYDDNRLYYSVVVDVGDDGDLTNDDSILWYFDFATGTNVEAGTLTGLDVPGASYYDDAYYFIDNNTDDFFAVSLNTDGTINGTTKVKDVTGGARDLNFGDIAITKEGLVYGSARVSYTNGGKEHAYAFFTMDIDGTNYDVIFSNGPTDQNRPQIALGTDQYLYANSGYQYYTLDPTTGDLTQTVLGPYNFNDLASGPYSGDQTYECKFDNVEKSRIQIVKTTNGGDSTSYDWVFAIFDGPNYGDGAAFLSNPLDSATTLNDPDNILTFDDLDPAGTYTVCETGNLASAGWTSVWTYEDAEGNIVTIPWYNPHYFDDPNTNVGAHCVDFGAGTGYPLTPGLTLSFDVDNSRPGGDPRTPGYWKNWSSCTNGGQYDKATGENDPDNEFWALDELLYAPPGFTVGDLELGEGDCEDAVAILDHRNIASGKKSANDAAYDLARNLFAYLLNQPAGACPSSEADSAASAGQQLLVDIEFDGTGRTYLRPKNDLYSIALGYSKTLDEYNNGLLCN